MERILASPASSQVVVSSVDLARGNAHWISKSTPRRKPPASKAHPPSPDFSPVVGTDDVEDRLAAIWREILGVQILGMFTTTSSTWVAIRCWRSGC